MTNSPDRIPIVENLDRWAVGFEAGWLRYVKDNVLGVPGADPDWDLYKGPRNRVVPPGKAVKLSESRLMLVSSAGATLVSRDDPFDAENVISDPTIRAIPSSTPMGDLRFDHTHYDHDAVDEDPQVQIPLRLLEEMVAEGLIGQLTENFVSFSGYQPDVRLVVDEVAPRILRAAREEKADAALLVPA